MNSIQFAVPATNHTPHTHTHTHTHTPHTTNQTHTHTHTPNTLHTHTHTHQTHYTHTTHKRTHQTHYTPHTTHTHTSRPTAPHSTAVTLYPVPPTVRAFQQQSAFSCSVLLPQQTPFHSPHVTKCLYFRTAMLLTQSAKYRLPEHLTAFFCLSVLSKCSDKLHGSSSCDPHIFQL